MMLTRPDKILRWEVLQEILEEGGFLWSAWLLAMVSANHTLQEVVVGEERRLASHIGALILGGERVAERLLAPALDADDQEQVVIAALALLTHGRGFRPEAVIDRLVPASPEQLESLAWALKLATLSDEIRKPLLALLKTASPEVIAAIIDVLAFRGDITSVPMVTYAAHPHVQVRAAALRALCLAPDQVGSHIVEQALAEEDQAIQAAGLELGLICGVPAAWSAAQGLINVEGAPGKVARLALACGEESPQVAPLIALLEHEQLRGDALWALGFSGERAAAEACLPWLADEQVGPLAAEALAAICGLELTGEYVRTPAAEEEGEEPSETDEEGPDEEGLDEEVGLDEEEGLDEEGLDEEEPLDLGDDLPVPEPEPIRRWWQEHAAALDGEVRYVAGKPFAPKQLPGLLQRVVMRRRPPHAFELAIRTRGASWINTRDLAAVQLQELKALGR